jgi:hypothetical protein
LSVAGGSVTAVEIIAPGLGYAPGDILSGTGFGAGVGFTVTVGTVMTSPVTQSIGTGFLIQVTSTQTAASAATISGSGFTVAVASVVTSNTGYLMTLGGHVSYGAPSSDVQTGNRWMTDGERLIRSHAKYLLASNVTRNQSMAQLFDPDNGLTALALRELRVEANRMTRRGVLRPMYF